MPGAEVRLRIHTHVREDALSLYGFLTQDEKALFEKLIGVSGIGPTLAVKVLSGLAAPDLIRAIRRGRSGPAGAHSRRRQEDRRAHGAGAARQAAGGRRARSRRRPPRPRFRPIDQDVLSALLNLGCARPQAEAAVRKAKAGRRRRAEFEPLFRRALELVR